MAGTRVRPVAQQRDIFREETFGPYAAADVGGANTYILLPFQSAKRKAIEGVTVCATVKSSVSQTMALAKAANGAAAPSGALAAGAAARVSENINLNTGITNLTVADVPLHPTTGDMTTLNNNFLEAGERLYVHVSDTPTSLAGLYITIRTRETV